MQAIVPILLSVVIGVVGQLILKTAMTSVGPLSLQGGQRLKTALAIGLNPRVWAGLGLYGFSLLFWLVGLSRVELGYAFPFLSLSYVLILVFSWALLRESIGWMRLVGVASICLGVTIVAAG
ncbi:MAG: EamA family transporter [Chloroflexota bacterium]